MLSAGAASLRGTSQKTPDARGRPAFGNNLPNEDPLNTGVATKYNLRFPGQYYDAETQSHYNHFRDYDPGIGRYIESDPIGLRGGLNTFAYVYDNPLILSDPTGQCPANFDLGVQLGTPSVEKNTPLPGQFTSFQNRSQIQGNLIQAHGTCSCPDNTMQCDYLVFWDTATRERPYNIATKQPIGSWGDWVVFPRKDLGMFRIPFNCKTGKLGSKGVEKL